MDTRDSDLNTAAPSDFYQLLSIDYEADGPAIRAAYRALQRVAHPDIAGGHRYKQVSDLRRLCSLLSAHCFDCMHAWIPIINTI